MSPMTFSLCGIFVLRRMAEKQPFAGTQPLVRTVHWPLDCCLDFSLSVFTIPPGFGFCAVQKLHRASQVVLAVKNLPANAENRREESSIPGRGRSARGGHSNPLQCSCLENSVDGGAWQATLHRVAESDTTETTQHSGTQPMMELYSVVLGGTD